MLTLLDTVKQVVISRPIPCESNVNNWHSCQLVLFSYVFKASKIDPLSFPPIYREMPWLHKGLVKAVGHLQAFSLAFMLVILEDLGVLLVVFIMMTVIAPHVTCSTWLKSIRWDLFNFVLSHPQLCIPQSLTRLENKQGIRQW